MDWHRALPIILPALLATACANEGGSAPDQAAPPAADRAAESPDAAPARDSVREGARAPDGSRAGGWGAKCLIDSECQSGFSCKSGKTDPFGYCTRSCAPTGSLCKDADLPSGTKAYCALVVSGTTYCGFLCKLGATTYACPGTAVCGTQETPPGTGQFWCVAQ